MKIEIDLYSSTQLRAFAMFMNALADENDSQVSEKLANYGGMVDKAYGVVGPAPSNDVYSIVKGQEANTTIAATRKRGEPSPGHKRRTKAEIAEDERAETQTEPVTAAISTGGERVAPDDAPEVEQADATDEADETAKTGAELSHDDVRGAMGKYVEKFGMDAAQIDLPKLFALALKDPAITKVSLIPGDQKSLKIVVDGVNEMLAKNPFSRDAVA